MAQWKTVLYFAVVAGFVLEGHTKRAAFQYFYAAEKAPAMNEAPVDIRLFDALPGNAVLIKPDPPLYTVLAVTSGYMHVTARSKERLVGKGLFETFPANPQTPTGAGAGDIIDSFEQVMRHKKPHSLTVQRYDTLNADGIFVERYWKIINNPVVDKAGGVDYIIHTVEEITDRIMAKRLKKEHEALSGSHAYLQRLINLFKAPLQVLEPVFENGEIVDFCYKMTNAAYAAYANTSPEVLRNKRVGDVFPGYFKTSSFTNVAETYKTGIADTWEIHYDVDGLDIYNEMSATKMEGEVVVHFTEFTKLKNLQLELERKVAELERSNQNLEAFAHAASHDLKEPVRKIQVFTGLLKKELDGHLNATERRTFDRIEDAAKRMGLLIEDLLLYSHVSQQPIEKEAVDLSRQLQRVVEDLELEIQQKRATVLVSDLPVVPGFKRQLQQLFQNLISNALKYSKDGEPPHIDIRAGTGDENGRPYHVISVTDNGIGFDQCHADKIFQLFTRLHGKAEYSGTGVGLSIVKKVVENHDGFIRVESKPGVGSTFSVCLPAD